MTKREMPKGDVPFSIPDSDDAGDRAKEYCKYYQLTPQTARIVRRGGKMEVEIIKPCRLRPRWLTSV